MAIMEQNNFEKKIQQKLEELKIPPSDAVWENVEKNINKRKDRKKILIFFLLFISLASGAYYIFTSITNDTNSKNQLVTRIVEKDSGQTKKDDSSFNQISVSPENTSGKRNESVENLAPKKTPSQKSENKKPESKRTNMPNTLKEKNLSVASENKITKEAKPIANDKKSLSPAKQTEAPSKQTNSEGNDLVNNSEKVQDGNIETQHEAVIQNKIIPATNPGDTNKVFSNNTDKSIIKINEKNQNRKWKLGVTFSGGTSMIGGGTAPKINNLSSSAPLNFVSFPSSANNTTLSSFNNYFAPSPIKNSMAFIGGVYIEKNISRKNKIDLGISYKYYSLINTTGNKIDFNIAPSLSAQSIYSSWSNTNTYRNNFHYIEIPISLKFQLGNSETLPIYWSAGVSISQLISSNSLQFKPAPGLYYNDNSLYNKTQIGLQTGFSALLFAKTKVPINIGPYFIYNMSKLANEGLYGGKHFSFIGIKTEILLGKK
jgi:hypothetical protein